MKKLMLIAATVIIASTAYAADVKNNDVNQFLSKAGDLKVAAPQAAVTSAGVFVSTMSNSKKNCKIATYKRLGTSVYASDDKKDKEIILANMQSNMNDKVKKFKTAGLTVIDAEIVVDYSSNFSFDCHYVIEYLICCD